MNCNEKDESSLLVYFVVGIVNDFGGYVLQVFIAIVVRKTLFEIKF
jgi:hypothetical protein